MKRLIVFITGILILSLVSCKDEKKGIECVYTKASYEINYDDLASDDVLDGADYKLISSSEEFDLFMNHVSSMESLGELSQYDSTIIGSVDYELNDVLITYEEGINTSSFDTCISKIEYKNGNVIINGTNEKGYPLGTSYLNLIFIIVPDKSFKKIDKRIFTLVPGSGTSVVYKPVIYLYNDEDLDLNIKFLYEDRLKTTYPKYSDGWNISLRGDVISDGKNNYYALFYDEERYYNATFEEGFYVEKDNAISFLEESLTALGFNWKERNECIMYWLPILEENEKSLVYFEQTEERNLDMPISMSKSPDSMLRVILHIKKVAEYVDIKEEKLNSFQRSGFTLVEWGGTLY